MAKRIKAAASQSRDGGDLAAKKDMLILDKIIGITGVTNSSNCVSCDGDVAWIAGCVAIVYNPKRNVQTRFLVHSKRPTPLSSLDFSPNGKYLAVGEGGHQPSVLVWDISSQALVAEYKAHKFGVEVVKFAPNNRHLVSIGFEHDQSLNVWDLATKASPVAKAAISGKISSAAFAADGSFFVTVGNKHLKFWSMAPVLSSSAASNSTFDPSKLAPLDQFDENSTPPPRGTTGGTLGASSASKASIEDPLEDSTSSSSKVALLEGRSAIARAYRDVTYHDVAVLGNNAVYAVTNTGALLSFNASSRVLDKAVDVKATKVLSVSATDQYIACGCTNGIVRLFHPTTLEYISAAPRPNPIGREVKPMKPSSVNASFDDSNNSSFTGSSSSLSEKDFADTVCVRLTSDGSGVASSRMVCFYSNRSIFIWDITNPTKMGKYRSFLAHNGCIWSIDTISKSSSKHVGVEQSRFGPGTFVTASADSSIRFWNLESSTSANIYCKELVECINVPTAGVETADAALAPESSRAGIRCVRVSPDGKQVACGDRSGTLRVYDIENHRILMQEDAHDDEILTVRFAQLEDRTTLLASGGRDRCMHLFGSILDESSDSIVAYTLRTTLEEHSSSVTSIAFSDSGQLVSGSSDKSLLFRRVTDGGNSVSRARHAVAQGTIFDVEFDPTDKYLISVGQEKRIAIYESSSARLIRAIKLESDSAGASAQLDVELDPSGLVMAVVGQDRVIRLFSIQSGELLASKITGHSELVTGIKFSHDGSMLFSIGGDGCIFIWRLAEELASQIRARLAKKKPTETQSTATTATKPPPQQQPLTASKPAETSQKPVALDPSLAAFFNPAELPPWARRAIASQQRSAGPGQSTTSYWDSVITDEDAGGILSAPLAVPMPKGKWAELITDGFTITSNHSGTNKNGFRVKLEDVMVPLSTIIGRRSSTAGAASSAGGSNTTEESTFSPSKALGPSSPSFSGSTAPQNAAVPPSKAAVTDDEEQDDFVDPAQLENMWTAFKEEPLDQLMKTGFESLTDKYTQSKPKNPNRLSLSAKYRKNHKLPSETSSDQQVAEASAIPETTAPAQAPTSTDPPAAISTTSPSSSASTPSSTSSTKPEETIKSTASAAASAPAVATITAAEAPTVTPTTAPASSAAAPTPAVTKPKDRKDLIAEEVERTRQRLLAMGMLKKTTPSAVPPAPAPVAANSPPSSLVSSTETPVPPISPIAPISSSVVTPAAAPVVAEPTRPEPVPQPAIIPPAVSPVEHPSSPQADGGDQNIVVDEATSQVIESIYDEDEAQQEQQQNGDIDEEVDGGGEVENVEDQFEEDLGEDDGQIGSSSTQEFLGNLSHAFDRTVELYLELKGSNRQDEVVSQIGSFFAQMREKLDRVLGPSGSDVPSRQTELLEKYSDLLVDLVKDKLNRK